MTKNYLNRRFTLRETILLLVLVVILFVGLYMGLVYYPLQDHTHDLQEKLDEEIKKNDELLDRIDNSIDCKSIAERTADVFKKLRDVRVGVIYGDDGEPCIFLSAGSLTPLDDGETELLKNYLMTESGLDKVVLEISVIATIPPVVKPGVEEK